MKYFRLILLFICAAAMTGCATQKSYDYTNYRASDPKSILVLPPKNASPDVKASYSVYSHTQRPLSESGYYVMPIAVVDEIFKTNGVTVVDEMHMVDREKLRKIFGADAVLYINISNYGTQYAVVSSASIVTASAKLVDLKNGATLWEGTASASSEEGQSNQGGLAGMLVSALVKQIINSSTEQSHTIARITDTRLLSAGAPAGLLYGPRSPLYKK